LEVTRIVNIHFLRQCNLNRRHALSDGPFTLKLIVGFPIYFTSGVLTQDRPHNGQFFLQTDCFERPIFNIILEIPDFWKSRVWKNVLIPQNS